MTTRRPSANDLRDVTYDADPSHGDCAMRFGSFACAKPADHAGRHIAYNGDAALSWITDSAKEGPSARLDVGGVVQDSNMDSNACGARMKSLSCIGPVGHAGNHVAYRGKEVLLWKPSNSYSFECSRDQING